MIRSIFLCKWTLQTRSTVLEYPFLSMVSEVGGYVGLMLGVAVVDLGLFLEKSAARLLDRNN